jgi:nitrite transporter NirC
MFMEVIEKVSNAGSAKVNLLNKSKAKYIVSSVLAGMFVGIGTILIFTVGGVLSAANAPYTRILMGVSFGIALSLVIMAGSELFTGNNAILTISTLNKKTTWKDTWRIWIYSFIGNLLGSLILAFLYSKTGLATGAVGDFIVKTAGVKMAIPASQLIIRGIFCNMLVCLAIWCSFKLQSEAAKLIMIFWCLFAFITSGFEHSIANMTLLAIGLFIPHTQGVTWAGYAYNVGLATLGNMIGGIIFVGLTYWYVSSDKK